MSPLHMGALLVGALSQGEVPQCMGELGTSTEGALLGTAIFLLEWTTLSNRLVFPVMYQIQVLWLFGGHRNGPPLSRDTSELAHLIPAGAVSRREKLVHQRIYSFLLPSAS